MSNRYLASFFVQNMTYVSILKKRIKASQKIALFWHQNIDGDALWSILAFWTILERLWKEVSYWTPEEPSKQFNFLVDIKKVRTNFDYHPHYDLLIVLDSTDRQQRYTEFYSWHEEYFEKMQNNIINIDHHRSNTNFWSLNIVQDKKSSTCEILTDIFRELDNEWIDSTVATYLYMWLSTDTWHFIFPNSSGASVYETATHLVNKWADTQSVITNIYRASSFKQFAFNWLLSQRLTKVWNVIYSRYDESELEAYGIDNWAKDSFLFLMTSIIHDGAFLFFKTHTQALPKPFIKISFRSRTEKVHVWNIAKHFNGGGHNMAAGWKIALDSTVQESIQEVIEKVNSHISAL